MTPSETPGPGLPSGGLPLPLPVSAALTYTDGAPSAMFAFSGSLKTPDFATVGSAGAASQGASPAGMPEGAAYASAVAATVTAVTKLTAEVTAGFEAYRSLASFSGGVYEAKDTESAAGMPPGLGGV